MQLGATSSLAEEYVVRIEVHSGHHSVDLLEAHVAGSNVDVGQVDLERLDQALALLTAIRLARLPLSATTQKAVQLFSNPSHRDLQVGSTRLRASVIDLVADEGIDASWSQRQSAIAAALQRAITSFARDVGRTIDAELDVDQADEAWQPGDDLAAERTRIVNYDGRPPLSGSDLLKLWSVSRQTLATWRRSGRLVGVPLGATRNLAYPRWQLDQLGRPLPGLDLVVGGLGVRDPWGVAAWLVRPEPALDGARPIDALRSASVDRNRLAALLRSEYQVEP